MQHSEPFENEAMLSESDHNKLVTISKYMLGGMGVGIVSIISMCLL